MLELYTLNIESVRGNYLDYRVALCGRQHNFRAMFNTRTTRILFYMWRATCVNVIQN